MRAGSTQRAQYIGVRLPEDSPAPPTGGNLRGRNETLRSSGRRAPRKVQKTGVYWRRRMVAVAVVLFAILALVFAAFVQTSGARKDTLPIDPNNAEPDAVLAEVSGVGISSPIRPEDVTGLGYHPEGESLVGMSPRGKNLSGNPLLGLFANHSTPEKIQYYLMGPVKRQGPATGALDVGAEAGAAVYAPVTGTVTSIRPDPLLQKDASVVEIKPTENPNVRVLVSLVKGIDDDVGPKSPVVADITQLGNVADSVKVMKPQLADYISDAGNHVTVSALQTN